MHALPLQNRVPARRRIAQRFLAVPIAARLLRIIRSGNVLVDGYEFVLPPHILNYECGFTAGQFPKFQDDVFQLKQDDPDGSVQFLLPTAETALINYYRDEIIDEGELPRVVAACKGKDRSWQK